MKLLPCPFCGKPALLEECGDHHGAYHNLGCPDRECLGHHAIYTESERPVSESVATWNTRTPLAESGAVECKVFVREPRYVVFKIKDIHDYLEDDEVAQLQAIGEKIACIRGVNGKPPFNAVVVEQNWPEFELVWSMIEARMTGIGNDSRRIFACVNFCAESPTELLEMNGVRGLQRACDETLSTVKRMIQAERQRDELLELAKRALKDLCGVDPIFGSERRIAVDLRATIAKAEGGE